MKIMIIVWKFTNKKVVKVKDSENLVFCIPDKVKNDDDENKNTVKEIIEKVIENNKDASKLLFIHDAHSLYTLLEHFNKSFLTHIFSGGKDAIYYNGENLGLLDSGGTNFHNDVLENDRIKKKIFNNTWDYYWKLCKKKLYELKEELLLSLYPVVFPLENGNAKFSLPSSLIEKINNFIDKKELFKDCDYGKDGKDILSDLKKMLKMLLENTADDLLETIEAKNSLDSKKNKFLFIPEYFRSKFNGLLILYNENEPVY